jgi:hypothetical protein
LCNFLHEQIILLLKLSSPLIKGTHCLLFCSGRAHTTVPWRVLQGGESSSTPAFACVREGYVSGELPPGKFIPWCQCYKHRFFLWIQKRRKKETSHQDIPNTANTCLGN